MNGWIIEDSLRKNRWSRSRGGSRRAGRGDAPTGLLDQLLPSFFNNLFGDCVDYQKARYSKGKLPLGNRGCSDKIHLFR